MEGGWTERGRKKGREDWGGWKAGWLHGCLDRGPKLSFSVSQALPHSLESFRRWLSPHERSWGCIVE